MSVKAKKHLGQHFLNDEAIAEKIADSLTEKGYDNVLEIGPGMGMLTKYLLKKKFTTSVIEIDSESVSYLQTHFLKYSLKIINDDFLKIDISKIYNGEQFAIIGNFPYNISSQIVFKAIENKAQVPELCGMFQKEVAKRITHAEGSKTYGIISVLTQAFYDAEYLFTVPPEVFNPPPKVESGVIRLIRKDNFELPVDESLFFKVVKTAFNQRRKTMRNSLKTFHLSDKLREDAIFAQRPEQLSVQQFIELTKSIEKDGFGNK